MLKKYIIENVINKTVDKNFNKHQIFIYYNAIVMENPISLFIETFNTNKVSIDKIYKFVNNNFDFSVDNIIKELDLLKPIYYDVACYGQFGRCDLNLSWKKIKDFKI